MLRYSFRILSINVFDFLYWTCQKSHPLQLCKSCILAPTWWIEPVKLFEVTLPSILTFALNLFFASVKTAPGGIIPCSTSSPKGIFGSSLRPCKIVIVAWFNIWVFASLCYAYTVGNYSIPSAHNYVSIRTSCLKRINS